MFNNYDRAEGFTHASRLQLMRNSLGAVSESSNRLRPLEAGWKACPGIVRLSTDLICRRGSLKQQRSLPNGDSSFGHLGERTRMLGCVECLMCLAID